MGEKDFREMTSSAEEVIDIYPNMFHFWEEFGCHCDISEAHQILWSLGILDEEFQFYELVISSSRVPSLQGQDDLMTVPGADLGGGCRGCAPPPHPRDDLRFSNTTGILQTKKLCCLLVLK